MIWISAILVVLGLGFVLRGVVLTMPSGRRLPSWVRPPPGKRALALGAAAVVAVAVGTAATDAPGSDGDRTLALRVPGEPTATAPEVTHTPGPAINGPREAAGAPPARRAGSVADEGPAASESDDDLEPRERDDDADEGDEAPRPPARGSAPGESDDGRKDNGAGKSEGGGRGRPHEPTPAPTQPAASDDDGAGSSSGDD